MDKKRFIIDLTSLTTEYSYLLDQVSKDVIGYVNEFSSDIVNDSNHSLASLFSIIASRHTYQNKLFVNLSYLLLIQTIIKKEKGIYRIVIPDKILLKPILLFLKNNNLSITIVINQQIGLKEKFRDYFRPLLNVLEICSYSIKLCLTKSKKRRDIIKLQQQEIILIDTFFLKNTIESQKYIDRYYSGMYEMVPERIKPSLYFVPTILSDFNKKDLNCIIDNSKENILYKHDFLNLKDYISSFNFMSKFKLPRKTYLFDEFDISSIVQKEFLRTKFSLSSFSAFLNYCFFKNVKNQRIDIKLLINWNENQVIDKGMIKGFKEFYPKSYVKGYQGFITSNDFHFYIPPTLDEVKNGVVADEICVVGVALSDNIKRFYKEIMVSTAPSFRFVRYRNIRVNSLPSKGVLLILPIRIEESVLIAKMFKLALDQFEKNKIEISIKSHPATNLSKLTFELDRIFSTAYNFLNGTILEVVKDYKVVIGSASSALVETICYGVPAIIIANNAGITQNPIPDYVDEKIWKLCYSHKELINAMQEFLYLSNEKRNELSEIGNQIQDDHFKEPNKELVANFLSCKKFN